METHGMRKNISSKKCKKCNMKKEIKRNIKIGLRAQNTVIQINLITGTSSVNVTRVVVPCIRQRVSHGFKKIYVYAVHWDLKHRGMDRVEEKGRRWHSWKTLNNKKLVQLFLILGQNSCKALYIMLYNFQILYEYSLLYIEKSNV